MRNKLDHAIFSDYEKKVMVKEAQNDNQIKYDRKQVCAVSVTGDIYSWNDAGIYITIQLDGMKWIKHSSYAI